MMNSISFNNSTIQWQHKKPQLPLLRQGSQSSKIVPANAFMLHIYSQKLWHAKGPCSSGKDLCCRANIDLLRDVGESNGYRFNPNYSITAQKIWNAVINLLEAKTGQEAIPANPKEVEISAPFIDHVFSPLIPDSPMLQWSHDKGGSSLKRAIGVFGLACEAPIRLLIVAGGHLLLHLYSRLPISDKSADHATYLQFRLGINAYSPIQEIAQRISVIL